MTFFDRPNGGDESCTNSQVTLDQISSHQFFVKQRVEDMDKRLQLIEVGHCPHILARSFY
jgi:hypothetical protein